MNMQFLRKYSLGMALGSVLLIFFSWGYGGATSGKQETSSSPPDTLAAEWNETAMSLTPTLGTHMGMRALTMMHTAMFDAVAAFDLRYQPYHVTASPPAGASQRAAAAAAAQHILARVFTDEKQQEVIRTRYDEHLSQIGDDQGKADGIAFGQSVAQAIWLLRSDDGAPNAMQVSHPDGAKPGEWRRTASGEPMAPGWGQVRPWTMTSGDQFDQGNPPPLTSPRYAADYNEVLMLGKKTSSLRTAEQSNLATFWNPHVPAKWNALARDISHREELPLVESARLFALMSLVMADSAISVWNLKYKYNCWRPETAIREGENDGNPETSGDPAWESFLPSPAFPEYVSGHSFTCAAAAALLERYLGADSYSFKLRTMGIPEPREFTSFRQAAEEAGRSRIYGGIHFQFANATGLKAGKELGQYVFDNFLRPRQP